MRTVSIDSLARRFITSCLNNSCQIISLGAGFDTRLFRLLDEFDHKLAELTYFEIDFEQVIREKQRIVENSPKLSGISANWRPVSLDLNSPQLNLSTALGTDFNPEKPTLIIAECCLMYLTSVSGDNLISWAASTCKSVYFCSFDPILAENLKLDPFARTMLDNFEDRGLDTASLLKYPTRESVKNRFSSLFSSVESFTMLQLEQDESAADLVSKEERRKLAIMAALDEYEEWNLLANHYLLVIAKK